MGGVSPATPHMKPPLVAPCCTSTHAGLNGLCHRPLWRPAARAVRPHVHPAACCCPQADLFEEIGVDSDETIGVVLSEFQQLLGKQARR